GVLVAQLDLPRPRFSRLERSRDGRDLGPGALGEGRYTADGLVAGCEVGQLLGRRWPPAADVGVVALDLVERRRGAVGHDDQAGRHCGAPHPWTSSTRRASTSGSVSGSTPWPRLK